MSLPSRPALIGWAAGVSFEMCRLMPAAPPPKEPMKTRPAPVAYRKHGQGLSKQTFQLSAGDLNNLQEVRGAFTAAHGVTASTSIILSLALKAITDEVRAGRVRWSDDLRSTVRATPPNPKDHQ